MDVCANCFEEEDIRLWIRDHEGTRGCDFCGRRDAPTVSIDELANYMRGCLENVWGYAIEQLPFESREDGYQGRTWDTWDILFDELELALPRDHKSTLAHKLCSLISQETWCEFDWLSLDEDEVLRTSWASFCEIVKHQRRFFFGDIKQDPNDQDHFVPSKLLGRLAAMALDFGLINQIPSNTKIYRARAAGRRPMRTPAELGPPPLKHALQSNRMNPPGVPMFYAAETRSVAVAEIQSPIAYVGTFVLHRDIAVLDLVNLPDIPGIFSGDERWRRLGLQFLHDFRKDVMKPVARDERTHIDYIPTQIVTEYFRHHGAGGIQLDGVRYPSTVVPGGRNLVLFATQADVESVTEPEDGFLERGLISTPKPWLKLIAMRLIKAKLWR